MCASIWVYHSFFAAAIILCQNLWPTIKKIKLHATNEKAQHGPNVFFGFAGRKGEGGIFHFLLVPNVFLVSSQWVPMMSTLCSHQVLIMFSMIFHDVPNMFFKFPLYSLTHSQEHLTFIPYGLANVVLLSSIYIIKEVWFAFWQWDLRNHHVLKSILGIFGKLLTKCIGLVS
jgi:hypothetical protein